MASAERPGVRHRSARAPRLGAIGALVLGLLLLGVVLRIAREGTPALVTQRTLAAYVRLGGTAPVLAWPGEGQAAVEVEGLGSFGTSGASTPAPIASLAKMMTAYLTLSEHPLVRGQEGWVATITPAEVEEENQRAALGESTVRVRTGERITERQALQALLLPSANNVAALLAAREAGGAGAFVARMNLTAKRLGMGSTTYTDPSGFADTTVSTAADQLKLARVAMSVAAFAAIVNEPSAELPLVGLVANYNGLIGAGGYVGVKTGSDAAAGGCLAFAKQVRIAGRRLIVLGVVLGQRKGALIEAALASASRLGDSAAASVRIETAIPAGTRVLSARSSDGRAATAVTTGVLRELGWGGLKLPVRVIAGPARTSLRAGERMATVAVQGASVAVTGAVASHSVAGPSFDWRLRDLL